MLYHLRMGRGATSKNHLSPDVSKVRQSKRTSSSSSTSQAGGPFPPLPPSPSLPPSVWELPPMINSPPSTPAASMSSSRLCSAVAAESAMPRILSAVSRVDINLPEDGGRGRGGGGGGGWTLFQQEHSSSDLRVVSRAKTYECESTVSDDTHMLRRCLCLVRRMFYGRCTPSTQRRPTSPPYP